MVSAVLLGSLILFLVLGVPVGIAIGIASAAALFAGDTLSPGYVAQTLVSSTDSFPIMAIPLFILAGELMGAGGVSRRILNVASVFFGRLAGGLAIVTVVVCMFFAAVSGSGPATVAAVGSMVVPTMLKKGYSKSFTLALIATAGSIGVIIPPSIPMVIFGVTTSTSISSMFLGGFGPGLLIGLSLIVYCHYAAVKNGWRGDEEAFSWPHARAALADAKWALLNPVIILGGIYAGIFTPTEAAAVAAVYAFVCGVFIHRELSLKTLVAPIGQACSTTGTTMVILGCASAFTRILTIEQIPAMITDWLIGITSNGILILMLINILLLIVGCFMDTTPAILVLSPILMPVALSVGVDPVHFGIIMVVNLAIGFITPPLGIDLFVAARIGQAPLEVVTRGIIPFIAVMIVCLLLVTYVPPIALFLPHLLGG
ncbi:TRAP transporter, DctM subunit [uncultured Alphaproteobacteria bacterium]|uniref:TRAP transporter large permease protein n=1 Tax=uncultured Alphaproteobacteria bacterium TaxID=91750 RepID=A0A212KMI0_9PROT|nr:TRAP transporter, DctM subunit [uncultured Alphaproteobacteria bacterium]